jgi:hypothetical protein
MVTDAALAKAAPVSNRSVDVERLTLYGVTLTVFLVQLACAWWLDAQGYLWGDAVSRASAALVAINGADPHLAAIGFIWMPLPTLLDIIPVSLYPWWNGVVQSGFASSIPTVLAGTLTAGIVFTTARRFELSVVLAAAYTLAVAFSPMLFLFSTNGMSEGVASPFLIGTVCALLLFWKSGQRRYVAIAGLLLAFAFACLYEAAPLGAAVAVALAAGTFTAETAPSTPQGRLRAIEGLSLLLVVPAVYVGVLWIIANWSITGDPLYFARSVYSNQGYINASGQSYLAHAVKGEVLASAGFVLVRTLAFAIPLLSILTVRLIEGRLFRINTLTMTAIALVVPFGLILAQLYDGSSFGWLRYFVYPLYVSAGWGLYEIASSRRRQLAIGLIMGAWLLTVPASLLVMANPRLGQTEHLLVRGVSFGEPASAVGYPMYFDDVESVADALDSLGPHELVLADSSNAWPIEATVSPGTLSQKLLVTSDDRFTDALRDPAELGVSYLLVPDPDQAPQDLLNVEYPLLWEGKQQGFSLAKDFHQTGQGWRLYSVDAETGASN